MGQCRDTREHYGNDQMGCDPCYCSPAICAVGWHFSSSCWRAWFVLRHVISSMQGFFCTDVLKPRFQVFSQCFVTVCFLRMGAQRPLMRLAKSQHLLHLRHGGFSSFTVSLDLSKNAYWLTSELREDKNPWRTSSTVPSEYRQDYRKIREQVGTWEFDPERSRQLLLQMHNSIGYCLDFLGELRAKAGKALKGHWRILFFPKFKLGLKNGNWLKCPYLNFFLSSDFGYWVSDFHWTIWFTVENQHTPREFLDLANNFGGNLRFFYFPSVQSCCHSAWEAVLAAGTGDLGLSLAHFPVGLYLPWRAAVPCHKGDEWFRPVCSSWM